MKPIGRTFANEVRAAGLHGLPFGWNGDGRFEWGDDITEAQRAAVLAVYEAHDPTALPPPVITPRDIARAKIDAALAAKSSPAILDALAAIKAVL
jgi:hypothetical protein